MARDPLLTPLDDTLQHQTTAPFIHVAHSDHRFFDRYWFEAWQRDGSQGFIAGMGQYSNMNAQDGFCSVQREGRQYNQRFARQLRPDVASTRIGPFGFEILEPLWRFRMFCEPGAGPVSYDLVWQGTFHARLEAHHFGRVNGRVNLDHERIDQVGRVDGWLEVDGQRVEVVDWWGDRDHSWGIRPAVGGFEPVNGPDDPRAGRLFLWFLFDCGEFSGHMQLQEDADGHALYMDGYIQFPDDSGRPDLRIVEVEHDAVFHPGTRQYSAARVRMTTDDGQRWDADVKPVLTAWAYAGTGYGAGFNDRKGLGYYRGPEVVMESDVYDVRDPEKVFLLDGTPTPSGHREQPALVTINGKPGYAHFPIMVGGRNARYGFS